MIMPNPIRAGLLALATLVTTQPPALAQDPIADYFKGKTMRIVIGYAPGGGYDIYGRVFAEHFGRYVPGNPTVVAQNMEGAGSFLAARYLYNVAPQDGTSFGSLAQTLPLDFAMGDQRKDLDASKMPYIGRMVSNIDLGAGMPGAWFKDFEDARTKEIVVGATGASSPGFLLPTALNAYAGSKFKVIYGYKGSNDVLLAAERKEVELIGAIGLATIMVRNPQWVTQRQAPIMYQLALSRNDLLPHVPALAELGQTGEGRDVLRALASSSEIGRSIITTPNVPPERLAALRSAFNAMMADPEFVRSMESRKIPLSPLRGEEVDRISRETLATPKHILQQVLGLSKGS